jgi:hypothetical protein
VWNFLGTRHPPVTHPSTTMPGTGFLYRRSTEIPGFPRAPRVVMTPLDLPDKENRPSICVPRVEETVHHRRRRRRDHGHGDASVPELEARVRALELRVELLESSNEELSNEVLQLKFFGTIPEAPPPLTQKLVGELTPEEDAELSACLDQLTLDPLTDEELHASLGDDLITALGPYLGNPAAFLPPSPPGSPVTVYAHPFDTDITWTFTDSLDSITD